MRHIYLLCLFYLIQTDRRIYAPVNRAIIGSNNDLSPMQHQSIIWSNASLLFERPLGSNVSEIWIQIHQMSLEKIHLKWRLQHGVYFGPNVVIDYIRQISFGHDPFQLIK